LKYRLSKQFNRTPSHPCGAGYVSTVSIMCVIQVKNSTHVDIWSLDIIQESEQHENYTSDTQDWNCCLDCPDTHEAGLLAKSVWSVSTIKNEFKIHP
jgi:hypothetical protein